MTKKRIIIIVFALILTASVSGTPCFGEGSCRISQGTAVIDDEEFYNDWEITDLYLPSSIKSVSYITNQQLNALERYHVDPDSEWLTSVDGVLYSRNGYVQNIYIYLERIVM